jgi:hypothetical protein
MERFNLKKYRVEVSNRFAALEDLDVEVEINSAENDYRVQQFQPNTVLGYELKHKP